MTSASSFAAAAPVASPRGLPVAEVQQLYRAHARWLHAWSRQQLGPDAPVQDAIQDVFLGLLRSGAGIAAARSSAAWLSVLTRHRCLDLLRRRHRGRRLLHQLTPQLGETHVPNQAEERQLLAALLSRLTPRQLQIARLLALGLSQAEIAQELGCSRQATHVRVLAIRRLATELCSAPSKE